MKCELEYEGITGKKLCRATLNRCIGDPKDCERLKRDKNGLRSQCENIIKKGDEFICDITDVQCTCIESLIKGTYYDCYLME